MEGIAEGRLTQENLNETPFLFDSPSLNSPSLVVESLCVHGDKTCALSLRTGRWVVDFNEIEHAAPWG